MKNYRLIPVLLVIMLIMASSCHRNNRKDFRERGARMGMMHNGFRGMMPGWRMGRMNEAMGHGPMMHGMGRGMNGMMPGRMGMAGMDSTGMPFGIGRRMMESIPNVTDSQKKQIDDLIKKNQEEIKKLHEEMASKMKNIMTTQRTEILNVMTDEQKKYLGNTEKTK